MKSNAQRRSLVINKIKFRIKLILGWARATWLMSMTMLFKRCSYGPFRGEFGHLLGHNLPFVTYLYSKGVKVDFCGVEIYKPFFVDEKGNSIVNHYFPLRDFFMEALPDSNKSNEPNDVKLLANDFIRTSRKSFVPYWDVTDNDFYFYFFRNWILKKGYLKAMDLSKVYKTKDERSCVIFPRNKGAAVTKNNGETWDYKEVAKRASSHFEKVYVIGHPAYSIEFNSFDNVEVCLTNDNKFILEKCCNSKLIVTPHSGVVYLGEYTNTRVLIIYKGGRQIGDIEITERFKRGLGNKYDFNYAFSFEEIDNLMGNMKM